MRVMKTIDALLLFAELEKIKLFLCAASEPHREGAAVAREALDEIVRLVCEAEHPDLVADLFLPGERAAFRAACGDACRHGGPDCGAESPDSHYTCTRILGHEAPHIACCPMSDNHKLAIWWP